MKKKLLKIKPASVKDWCSDTTMPVYGILLKDSTKLPHQIKIFALASMCKKCDETIKENGCWWGIEDVEIIK